MTIILIIFFPIIALSLSLILTRVLANPEHKLQILDHPNERSLHKIPVTRTGGLAICSTIFMVTPIVGVLLNAGFNQIAILIGALVISIISLLDDRFTLNVIIRLIMHLSVAALLLIAGYGLSELRLPLWLWQWPIVIGVTFSILYIV